MYLNKVEFDIPLLLYINFILQISGIQKFLAGVIKE